MYVIKELWVLIKSFLIHNIKIHGAHLKNDENIINYNQVMKTIPKPQVPLNGPRIMINSVHKHYRFIRFVYHMYPFYIPVSSQYLTKKRTIIEHQLLDENYNRDYDPLTRDSRFRQEYFNQYK